MFSDTVLFNPDTNVSNDFEAVLMLTPTWFTALLTIKSRDSVNFFCDTSC